METNKYKGNVPLLQEGREERKPLEKIEKEVDILHYMQLQCSLPPWVETFTYACSQQIQYRYSFSSAEPRIKPSPILVYIVMD